LFLPFTFYFKFLTMSAMALRMTKSASVPGIMQIGTADSVPKKVNHFRQSTFSFKNSGNLGSAVDLHKGNEKPSEASRSLAALMKNPSWRTMGVEEMPEIPTEEDLIPKNMRYPKIQPAWMKHEKQVLRFYGFFQEAVTERPDENSRYRNVTIMYCMEDGTMSMTEPKVENSGIPQGQFLKRHRVPREDGQGFIGPDDFRVGQELTFYGRTYHITGCDRFTRWFYEENGIDVGEDEPLVVDSWQKNYKLQKTIEKGGLPATKSAVDAKNLTKFQIGHPPADKKFTQFLLNDRKVLRFKCFWDDQTPYGARKYYTVHYYLADNTCEINEAHVRNSGAPHYPLLLKRGPLHKSNHASAVPGLLIADAPLYLPEDLQVGGSLDVWGRTLMIYDCDDFTRKFYQEYLGIDQFESRIDVSEKPVRHIKLAPPPHNGIGKPEDSLINTQMIQPKAPKIDLEKMMVLTGEVLRFECKMANGEPEDELRKLVIAFYPADDETAVFEMPVRNSGHMGGKFAKKERKMNPETGEYFKLSDFYVGKTVYIASQPLQITRADEHCMQYLEARPQEFPYADPVACCKRLAPLVNEPEMNDPMGIEPDRLRELAYEAGVPIVDHEIITLLRRFGIEAETEYQNPRILGAQVLEIASS